MYNDSLAEWIDDLELELLACLADMQDAIAAHDAIGRRILVREESWILAQLHAVRTMVEEDVDAY